jgi:hypothetical protein
MILHILPKLSPTDRELIHRATQPGSQFFSIDAGELEGWTLRFLALLADKPSWENTVSLTNEHHQTLAHLAVLFRYTTLLKKVTQWGIDVDVQDVNGFTALHYAYLCGDLDSVGILKGNGADEDIQDNLGRRPLDMYIPSPNDPGRHSPSSDRTSSSAQGPTAGEEDWESVSRASSQPGSFSDYEATTSLPASRHQSLHTRESTTSSSVVGVSFPPLTGDNSFLTDDWELIKALRGLNLSASSISLEHTSSLKKSSNESNWECNQDIQSSSSLQETISKPSPSEGGDRDSPGEYEWYKNNSIDFIYRIKLVSADLFTRCSVSVQILKHQKLPLFLSRLPPSTSVASTSKLPTHNPFPNWLSQL